MPVFDSISLPLCLFPYVITLYRDINYDIFCKTGLLQDSSEGIFNPFESSNLSLLESYIEHFITDLKSHNVSHAKITELKAQISSFLTIMKTSSDFELFDYEILNHATYLKSFLIYMLSRYLIFILSHFTSVPNLGRISRLQSFFSSFISKFRPFLMITLIILKLRGIFHYFSQVFLFLLGYCSLVYTVLRY